MDISVRSYLTAGVAALSVGAMALSPVQALPQTTGLSPQLSQVGVELAAAIDPITPWITTIQTAADNFSSLVQTWAAEPLPIVQQVVKNAVTYLGELPDIGTIAQQAFNNIGNAVMAPFAADLNTLDTAHTLAFEALPELVDNLPQGLLDFTTTAVSGLLLGAIGPVLSPVLALVQSVQSAFAKLSASDFAGAINDVINIPAAMVNAFLNGGPTIDLSGVLAPLLPAGSTLNSASLALGGLLSTGASIFNAVAVDADVKVGEVLGQPILIPIEVPAGPAPGIFGSLIALTQAVATAITVTPPNKASRSAAAKAVAAEEPEAVTAPEDTAQVETPEPVAVALNASPSGERAPARKQASRGGGAAKAAASTGKAPRSASKARTAASRAN